MALSKFQILALFKDNLIKFLDALIEKLPQERELITMRVLFSDQIPIETAMERFSSRVIPYEDLINNSDESFIINNNNDLFSGITSSKVSYMKKIWSSSSFTQEDKEELWKWFKIFLKLAKLYNSSL